MRTLTITLLLSFSACGQDTASLPPDAGWTGDPSPSGTYRMPTVFKQLCEDGSDRTGQYDFTFILEAGPDATPDGLFTLDVRVVPPNGIPFQASAWAGVAIASDGTFDTGDLNRVDRMGGRFERYKQMVRAEGRLTNIVVEPDHVQCDQTFDFASP